MNGASFVSWSNDYHPVPQLVLVTSRDLLSCLRGAMTKMHLLLDFLSTLNCRMAACRRAACHRAAWRSSRGMANKLGSNKETNTLAKENKSKCKCAMTPMSNMHHNLQCTNNILFFCQRILTSDLTACTQACTHNYTVYTHVSNVHVCTKRCAQSAVLKAL